MFTPSGKRIIPLLAIILLMIGFTAAFVQAQEQAPTDGTSSCNLDTLVHHQQEHALALDHLDEQSRSHREAALEALYTTGLAYEHLALRCGFTPTEEAQAGHHSVAAVAPDTEATETVQLVGDPENGQVLFETVIPDTGFVCATCHLTDSTDRLIGPGLQGIGDTGHDPSAHAHESEAIATSEPMDMHLQGNFPSAPCFHPSEAGIRGLSPIHRGMGEINP
jgi:hypothetical protein